MRVFGSDDVSCGPMSRSLVFVNFSGGSFTEAASKKVTAMDSLHLSCKQANF